MLTLSASDWNFGLPNGTLVVVKEATPDDPQDFDFTTDGGLSPPSFSLDDDSDGTLSNTQTFDDLAPGRPLLGHGVGAGGLEPGLRHLRRREPGRPTSRSRPARPSPARSPTHNSATRVLRARRRCASRSCLHTASARTPDHTHGGPLSYPSCGPPSPVEGQLTVGTPDANGRGAKSLGFVRMAVLAGDAESGSR